jgi:hypothetical protein
MIVTGVLAALVAQPTPSPMASPCQAEVDLLRADYPTGFEAPGELAPLSATVLVLVEPDGKVAHKSKLIDCKPVEGTFLFKTSLTPNTP